MAKLFIGIFVVILCPLGLSAQVRPVSDDDSTRPRSVAPASVEAKYEGGMFGNKEKESGQLKFDDANERLVFYVGKTGKEKFSVPYKAMTMVYPNHESVTLTTGNVVRHLPVPGAGLFSLIKEKRRFLVIQFEDTEVDVLGTVNFRLENRETLERVIEALGRKGNLTQRGDAYYRSKPKS